MVCSRTNLYLALTFQLIRKWKSKSEAVLQGEDRGGAIPTETRGG